MGEQDLGGLGDVIRESRISLGWSQSELAARSRLSRPTIARMEANNNVSTAAIAKAAQALGLKLELR